MIRPFRNGRDSAAPGLLVTFTAGTLVMVLALVLLLRNGSDWVDFVAIALLLAVAAFVLIATGREIGEEEPPGDDDPDERRASPSP
jgi:Ca2+/Na+ antiporter